MKNFTPEQNKNCAVMHWVSIIGLAVPLGAVFGTLFTWLLKKNDGEHYDAHGKEACNFQLTLCAVNIVHVMLSGLFSLGMRGSLPLGIFFTLLMLINVAAVFYAVYMGIKAHKGAFDKYKFSYKFL